VSTKTRGAALSERYERRGRERRRAAVGRAAGSVAIACLLAAGIAAAGGWAPWEVAENDAAQVEGAAAAEAGDDEGFSAADATGATDAADADAATRTVVDSAGRTVTLPAELSCVAVMDPFSGEAAVMVGAGAQVYGMPAGASSDLILQQIYPGLADVASLSGGSVNVETLLAAGCDAVIVKGTLGADELAKLERVGIPYVVVGYGTFAEQMDALRLVGAVFGGQAQERAEGLAAAYEAMVDLVAERLAGLDEGDRLRVYHAINDALLTDAAGSLGADWVQLAGCVDVSAGEEATSGSDYTATLEQVYAWDPDLVVCNVAATAQEIAADSQWRALGAVEAGRVLNIPVGATRWGQRGDVETACAVLWLAAEAYPELMADVDVEQVVRDYYRDELGVELGDELWEAVLSGEGVRTSGGGNGNGGNA
jgi:iron complex transport system substrate-binding protein